MSASLQHDARRHRGSGPHISVLAGVAFWLTSWTAASATVIVMPDDESLVRGATSVVLGRVVAVDPFAGAAIGAGPGQALTDVTIAEAETLAGLPMGHEIVLRLPGGVDAAGRGLAIEGLRPPDVGTRLVAFVEPGPDGVLRPHQLMLGIFTVDEVEGEAGVEAVAYRPRHGARWLPDPKGDVGPHHGSHLADAPRNLAAWRAWLRDHDRGTVRAKDFFVAGAALAPRLEEKFHIAASSGLPAPLGCGDDGGRPVRWSAFDDGETTAIARGGTPIDGLGDGGAEAIAEAIANWSTEDTGSDTSIRLADGGLTDALGGLRAPDGTTAILTGDPNDTIPGRFESVGLLALGGAWLDCARTELWGDTLVHPVIEADVVVQDGIESFFAASTDPEAAAAELFTHELGHALGFAHSDDPEALMFGVIRDDGRGGTLGADDRSARSFLYPPIGPPPGAEPPATPTAFVALLAEDNVALAWRAETPSAAVRVERSTDGGPFRLLTAIGGAETYFDRDVLPGTTYAYRLIAFDQGGSSAPTESAEVTTDGTIAPRAPSNLRWAPRSPTSLRLTWQDNAEDELFYRIESRIGGFWETLPQTLPADSTDVVIDGLEYGLVYRFRIRAVGVLAASVPSNQAAAATLPPDATCTPADGQLCLLSGRFAVSVRFRNPLFGNGIDRGSAVPETDNTGRFWFFRENNTELIVKMIDGESANGFAWVFYGGLSDLEYWIDIEDTETGRARTFYNPPGALCGASDTQAFPLTEAGSLPPLDPPPQPPTSGPPEAPTGGIPLRVQPLEVPEARNSSNGGPCEADDETLCLLDGRFAVRVDFRNQHGGGETGVGQAIDGGNRTGFFYFFTLRNTELVVKILDGRTINDHFWIFFGGLSDVEYTLEVTDTETGAVQTFFNPPGEVCGGKDTQLFFERPDLGLPDSPPPI